MACDVPSGRRRRLRRGGGRGRAGRRHATFHGSKIGLWVAPGALHAGRVEVVPIGVPRGAPAPAEAGLISVRVLEPSAALAPRLEVHVGRRGDRRWRRGLTGRPRHGGDGAQRTGAGYVQVAVPLSAQPALDLRLLEAMTRGLAEEDGGHAPRGCPRSSRWPSARRGRARPGLGRAAARWPSPSRSRARSRSRS